MGHGALARDRKFVTHLFMKIAVTILLAGIVAFTFMGGCMLVGLPERWCIAVSAMSWAIAVLITSVIWLEASFARR